MCREQLRFGFDKGSLGSIGDVADGLGSRQQMLVKLAVGQGQKELQSIGPVDFMMNHQVPS